MLCGKSSLWLWLEDGDQEAEREWEARLDCRPQDPPSGTTSFIEVPNLPNTVPPMGSKCSNVHA